MSYRAKLFEDTLKEILDDIDVTLPLQKQRVTLTSDDEARRALVKRIRDKAEAALRRD